MGEFVHLMFYGWNALDIPEEIQEDMQEEIQEEISGDALLSRACSILVKHFIGISRPVGTSNNASQSMV